MGRQDGPFASGSPLSLAVDVPFYSPASIGVANDQRSRRIRRQAFLQLSDLADVDAFPHDGEYRPGNMFRATRITLGKMRLDLLEKVEPMPLMRRRLRRLPPFAVNSTNKDWKLGRQLSHI
jgi:hypothetical protein